MSDEPALLNGHRSDAWKQIAALIFQGGQVTDYEYLAMARDAEVGLHQHAASAIHRSTEFLAQW